MPCFLSMNIPRFCDKINVWFGVKNLSVTFSFDFFLLQGYVSWIIEFLPEVWSTICNFSVQKVIEKSLQGTERSWNDKYIICSLMLDPISPETNCQLPPNTNCCTSHQYMKPFIKSKSTTQWWPGGISHSRGISRMNWIWLLVREERTAVNIWH